MKKLFLSSGDIVLIDDEDFESINQFKWSVWKWRKKVYAKRKMVISKKPYKRKTIGMHQFILGDKEGFVIDHKDSNGLNNQKSNLRYVTVQFNAKYRYNISNENPEDWL